MGYRGQARHIPEKQDTTCSKCGLIVEIGDGRRYRMKYRHFHCLPETRLAQIRDGTSEAIRTERKYKEATRLKNMTEEEERQLDEMIDNQIEAKKLGE